VQRLLDGTVQLTPVFDFAPMYLDIEVIESIAAVIGATSGRRLSCVPRSSVRAHGWC
jgi:hypothetical protein